MSIRVGTTSYGMYSGLIEKVKTGLPPDVELIVLNGIFSELEEPIRAVEENNSVDVFIASGGNAEFLSKYLKKIPLVTIKASGFDVLSSLHEAKAYTDSVAIITYKESLPNFRKYLDVLDMSVEEVVYTDPADVDDILRTLHAQGVQDVIGGTYVLERARIWGVRGYYLWSENGIREAVDNAVSLARNMKFCEEKAKKLDYILDYAAEGIILTDANGIVTEFNASAEKILRRNKSEILGKYCHEVFPNTQLHIVLQTRRAQYNQVQDFGVTKIVVNRIPVINNGELIGSLATFLSVQNVRQAELSARQSQFLVNRFPTHTFSDLPGKSPAFLEMKADAERYAGSNSPIFLCGKSGIRNGPLAESIHNRSTRKNQPLIILDCKAYSEDALEWELFGGEDGAVPGLRRGAHQGCIEAAHSGTLFLENIDALPLTLQARLQNVIERKEVSRIGSQQPISVDVRFITASQHDLWTRVEQGSFLESLYYSLNVLYLPIPALRDRPDDIPLLIKEYLPAFRNDLRHSEIEQIASLKVFREYKWPGNVQELKTVLERFCIHYQPGADAAELADLVLDRRPIIPAEEAPVHTEEKAEIERVLRLCGGNRNRTAERLGISRTTLWRKLKEYEIEG